MMTRNSSRNHYKRSNFLDKISLDWYLASGSMFVVVQACTDRSLVSYLTAAAWLGICAICVSVIDKNGGNLSRGWNQFYRRYRSTGVWGIVFGVCALTSLFFYLAEPSQAQLLFQAESVTQTLLKPKGVTATSQGTLVNDTVTTMFNLLRVIMLITFIVCAFKMFQARDDQDDVKNQFRPIWMMMGLSTLVDVAARFMRTGTATTPTTP